VLVVGTRLLEGDLTLGDAGVSKDATLHLSLRLRGAGDHERFDPQASTFRLTELR